MASMEALSFLSTTNLIISSLNPSFYKLWSLELDFSCIILVEKFSNNFLALLIVNAPFLNSL